MTETRRGRLDRIDSALGLFALGLWLALPAGLVAGLIGWGDVAGTFVLLAAAIGAGFVLLDLARGRRECRLLGGFLLLMGFMTAGAINDAIGQISGVESVQAFAAPAVDAWVTAAYVVAVALAVHWFSAAVAGLLGSLDAAAPAAQWDRTQRLSRWILYVSGAILIAATVGSWAFPGPVLVGAGLALVGVVAVFIHGLVSGARTRRWIEKELNQPRRGSRIYGGPKIH